MSPDHCIPIVWYFGKSELSFQENVWRYQRGNHKPETEGQRTDNAMTKRQKNKMTTVVHKLQPETISRPHALLMIRIVMYYEQGTNIHWLIVTECGNNFVQVFIVCFYLNCRWEVTVFLLSFSNVYLMIVLQIISFEYNCINKSQVIKLNTNNTTSVPTKYLYIVNLYIRHSIFCLIREYFSNIILKVLDKTVEYLTFISFKLDKKRTRDNSFF